MTGYAIPIGGATTWTARQDRQSRAGLWAPGASGLQSAAGVRPGPGLDVTVTSGVITVTAGAALVQSAASSLAGSYHAWLDAAWTTGLTAADASNPRSDLVYLQVRDADEDGSGARDCTPVYVVGTPAASPVTPSIPVGTSGVVLGAVTVPKVGGGSPTVSYIGRPYAVAAGGVPPVQSGLLGAAGLYVGQSRYNLVRGTVETWTGTAWVAPGDWTPYATAWTAATTNPAIGNGAVNCRYSLVGRNCTVKYEIATGTTTTYGNGQWALALPFTSSGNGTAVSVGSGHGITASGRWHLQILATAAQPVANLLTPASQTDGRLVFIGSGQGMGGVTWTSGQTLRAQLTYEIA